MFNGLSHPGAPDLSILVNTGTVLNAHVFIHLLQREELCVQALAFGQLELSRMELPTLDKGQDIAPEAATYIIHRVLQALGFTTQL